MTETTISITTKIGTSSRRRNVGSVRKSGAAVTTTATTITAATAPMERLATTAVTTAITAAMGTMAVTTAITAAMGTMAATMATTAATVAAWAKPLRLDTRTGCAMGNRIVLP